MSGHPLVTAVMLVDGRHGMAARAVQSFMRQTYPRDRRYLLMWDSGDPHYAPPFVYDFHGIEIWHRKRGGAIGFMRNAAIAESKGEIIIQWDSDDVSSDDRITEQVELLESSGADAVGYSEMFFADTRDGKCNAWCYRHPHPHYLIGTSLAFHRRVWEAKPFPDLPKPGDPQSACEDTVWQYGLKCVAVSAATDPPKMIATVHGANTRLVIDPHCCEWTRRTDWDEKLRGILEAA